MEYPNFSFTVGAADPLSQARVGRLVTPHGVVETPAFIFCATKGAMKAMMPQDLPASGTQIILSNTYHLMIQPGPEPIEALGGLHRFMGWRGPMLTDSGGFQIFSLGHGSVASEIKGKREGVARPSSVLKISEEGVCFRSYLDGSRRWLTPEISVDIQRALGPDLVVVFDECTPFHVDKSYTEQSMHRSHRWEDRSLAQFARHHDGTQALYGIVQGGVYPDLRRISADFVRDRPFFGQAIGGSLGASRQEMMEVVGMVMGQLHRHRPTHLLGIGGLWDIFQGVRHGIDSFDCVHPTRLARHGGAIVPWAFREEALSHKRADSIHGAINLRNQRFSTDDRPLDPSCLCSVCGHLSRAYLHWMLKAKEMVALQALTLHNVATMNRIFASIRAAIPEGRLAEVEREWLGET